VEPVDFAAAFGDLVSRWERVEFRAGGSNVCFAVPQDRVRCVQLLVGGDQLGFQVADTG
jgi:hypothetical protein